MRRRASFCELACPEGRHKCVGVCIHMPPAHSLTAGAPPRPSPTHARVRAGPPRLEANPGGPPSCASQCPCLTARPTNWARLHLSPPPPPPTPPHPTHSRTQVRALKQILEERGISYAGLAEKSELVDRILERCSNVSYTR